MCMYYKYLIVYICCMYYCIMNFTCAYRFKAESRITPNYFIRYDEFIKCSISPTLTDYLLNLNIPIISLLKAIINDFSKFFLRNLSFRKIFKFLKSIATVFLNSLMFRLCKILRCHQQRSKPTMWAFTIFIYKVVQKNRTKFTSPVRIIKKKR